VVSRGRGHKLKDGRFPLNIRKCLFFCTLEHGVREVVKFPSLEMLLDMVLGNLL